MSPTAGMTLEPPDGASGRRDLARVGALVSDQARCRMLLALGDGRPLPASALLWIAGLPPVAGLSGSAYANAAATRRSA